MAKENIFEQNPLAGIPTEILIDELLSRYSNAIFVYTLEGKEKDTALNGWRTFGSCSEVLGLAQFAEVRAQRELIEYIEDV